MIAAKGVMLEEEVVVARKDHGKALAEGLAQSRLGLRIWGLRRKP